MSSLQSGAVGQVIACRSGMDSSNQIHNNSALNRRRAADSVFRWLRSCSVCGSTLPPIDLLCDECWRYSRGPLASESVDIGHSDLFPVYSLFTWTPTNDSLVGPLIQGFKKGWSAGAAKTFAELISAKRMKSDEPPKELVFVTPPPSARTITFGRFSLTGQSMDHAGLLAACLSESWRAPWISCLRAAESENFSRQKNRTAVERRQRRFVATLNVAEDASVGKDTTVVFVDDVVTTGATAMAAYMALGDPSRFEVWAIAQRPKLAVQSSI